MTVTVSNIITAQTAATTATTYFTCPANTKVIIDKLTATNVSGSNVAVTVNLVNAGGVAGGNNTISASQTIAASVSYSFPEVVGHVLEPGQFININASTAAVTIRASGRVIA